MKRLADSPYHTIPQKHRRRLTVHVDEDDYNLLYEACPQHGLQDSVLGHLFHTFMQELKSLDIKPYYEQDNVSKIEGLLRGSAVPQAD